MIMPIIRVSLKPQSPLTNRSAPRCWHLAQGGKWNSERHLVRRHADLTLWLWKLISVDRPEKSIQFSPLALGKKRQWKRKENQCSLPTFSHSLQRPTYQKQFKDCAVR